ncbi:MAG TPA: aminotransferase class I/II-fold pyridoxal phosphate-dependent enzyme [Candidatus Aminicenantes bacterium]|nr:aminotransferase class I/II-fold pyridoxal phosphate-dependent enzyme [Candidatus Aminicenantes bacterium]
MTAYERLLAKAFDPEEFRREGKKIVDLLADFLAASEPEGRSRVFAWEDPESMFASWAGRFAAKPSRPFADLLPEILDRSNNLLHPRYVGHQCTTALPLAALGGLAGQLLNNGTAIYEMGPVNAAMERHLIRWMAGLAGFGPGADGVFTSGGSGGNLTALLAARQAAAEGDIWRNGAAGGAPLAILASSQCHYSVRRSAAIMGLGEEAVVPVDVDEKFHMTASGFGTALAEAGKRGRRPFALVANACSTATGSYDDLEQAADWAAAAGLWLHVDGAHGAGALLSPKYRSLLRGLERADSFIWDAHKSLLMPALVTAVVFRDGGRSFEAFSQNASYLFEKTATEEWYNFAHRTLECTKTMMGMRLFISLAAYGTDFFAGYVTAAWDLAREFARRLRTAGDFETASEPESNIVCFRHLKKGEPDLDGLQRRIRRILLEQGRFYVVQTQLDGRTWLRCTLINPRTTAGDLDALMEEIRSAGRS